MNYYTYGYNVGTKLGTYNGSTCLETSRLEQKWFISVRGESEKNAIEVSRCCGLRAQLGSRYLL